MFVVYPLPLDPLALIAGSSIDVDLQLFPYLKDDLIAKSLGPGS